MRTGDYRNSSVLNQYFLNDGTGCYVLAGDNYPRRIPKDNDEERLRIYNEKGMEGLREYPGTPDEISYEDTDFSDVRKLLNCHYTYNFPVWLIINILCVRHTGLKI